jgi:hypothetical protein
MVAEGESMPPGDYQTLRRKCLGVKAHAIKERLYYRRFTDEYRLLKNLKDKSLQQDLREVLVTPPPSFVLESRGYRKNFADAGQRG